jgi:hypothetical protein
VWLGSDDYVLGQSKFAEAEGIILRQYSVRNISPFESNLFGPIFTLLHVMNAIDTTLNGDVRDTALSLDPQASGQKPTTRSCQLCHQRKIRCDKTLPCSNCVRGHTSCYYPGTERKARRPHKTTITDVASRVTKLERVIVAMSNHHGIATEAAPTTEGQAFHAHDGAGVSRFGEVTIANHPETRGKRESSTEELLVQDGESSCYVNEVLLSRVLDEVKIIQLFYIFGLR